MTQLVLSCLGVCVVGFFVMILVHLIRMEKQICESVEEVEQRVSVLFKEGGS